MNTMWIWTKQRMTHYEHGNESTRDPHSTRNNFNYYRNFRNKITI